MDFVAEASFEGMLGFLSRPQETRLEPVERVRRSGSLLMWNCIRLHSFSRDEKDGELFGFELRFDEVRAEMWCCFNFLHSHPMNLPAVRPLPSPTNIDTSTTSKISAFGAKPVDQYVRFRNLHHRIPFPSPRLLD